VPGVVAHPYRKTSKAQKMNKNSCLRIALHLLSTVGMLHVFMDKLIQRYLLFQGNYIDPS
jgi:hypothetical protein